MSLELRRGNWMAMTGVTRRVCVASGLHRLNDHAWKRGIGREIGRGRWGMGSGPLGSHAPSKVGSERLPPGLRPVAGNRSGSEAPRGYPIDRYS